MPSQQKSSAPTTAQSPIKTAKLALISKSTYQKMEMAEMALIHEEGLLNGAKLVFLIKIIKTEIFFKKPLAIAE